LSNSDGRSFLHPPPNGFRWDFIEHDPAALGQCLRHDPPVGMVLYDEAGAFDADNVQPEFSGVYYVEGMITGPELIYRPIFYDPMILKQTHAINFSAVLFMHGLRGARSGWSSFR
jgi:hypothetical protein